MQIENSSNEKRRKFFGTSNAKDSLVLNGSDNYNEVVANIDMAHGCIIIAEVLVDVAADVVVDVAADAVADAAADGAADAATDAAADAAADSAADGAADAAIDAGADGGVASSTSSTWANLFKFLGTAVIGAIVSEIVQAITDAISSSGNNPPSSQTYWTSLYNTMIANYPCNSGVSTGCGSNIRACQIAMVSGFAIKLSTNTPDANVAMNFENSAGYSESVAQLKQTLVNISATGGVPAMVQYMETYTAPGASGAGLVIATANTVVAVASYVYPDAI